jgi:hypothetical protein
VAEDSHVPPLPRRTPDDERHVPGGTPGWGSGLTHSLALPEALQQRIRAALDYTDDEAPPPANEAPLPENDAPPPENDAPPPENDAPPPENDAPPPENDAQQAENDSQQAAEAIAGQPASLPQRVPGANNAPEPPAYIAQPAMLPSLVHPAPAEELPALPAATLGAIAAAAGTPSSDIAAQPQAAAPAKAAVWPAPATASTVAAPAVAEPAGPPLVPAQRSPAEQQPDRHEFRDGAGNGARPPGTPMTRVAMWAHLTQAEAPTEPFPVIPAAGPGQAAEKTGEQPEAAAQPGPAAVPAAEPPAVPAQRVAPSLQENVQASLSKPQLHGTKGLARRPGESPPWAPVPSPATAPPKFGPPASVSPRPVSPAPAPLQAPASPPGSAPPPESARRGRSFKVAVVLALILALAGSLAFLLGRPGSTAQAIDPTTRPTASAALRTAAEVRAATAAWVASQVSRAKPISCDPVMCQALRADGVPAADLLVLRPGGGDPLRSGVIVVTPTVTKMVGTEFLTADAPAAIASFGSGSRQDSVRVIYPQGAAAYAAALRQDIAERKANEVTLLENPRVTAPPSVRQQLQGGQVDSRLLLALAQLASQWPLSIVAFGDRAPGASPGVPLRSADLAVTGDAAGRARQMAAFARQLQDFYASARIRVVRLANGQDGVQVVFPAPSPLGVLNQ